MIASISDTIKFNGNKPEIIFIDAMRRIGTEKPLITEDLVDALDLWIIENVDYDSILEEDLGNVLTAEIRKFFRSQTLRLVDSVEIGNDCIGPLSKLWGKIRRLISMIDPYNIRNQMKGLTRVDPLCSVTFESMDELRGIDYFIGMLRFEEKYYIFSADIDEYRNKTKMTLGDYDMLCLHLAWWSSKKTRLKLISANTSYLYTVLTNVYFLSHDDFPTRLLNVAPFFEHEKFSIDDMYTKVIEERAKEGKDGKRSDA